MAEGNEENTLVILKPDSFWRNLDRQVEGRLKALGLTVVAELTLASDRNLPEEKWREFYFPAIGNRPPCLAGTSKYMAYGPVKVIQFKGNRRRPEGSPGGGRNAAVAGGAGHDSRRFLARGHGSERPVPADISAAG